MSRREQRAADTRANRHHRRQAALRGKFGRASNPSQRVSAAADYLRSTFKDVPPAEASAAAAEAVRYLVGLADQLVVKKGGR